MGTQIERTADILGELTEKTMSHFGIKKILNFGKSFLALLILILCFFSSCRGWGYSLPYEKDKLQDELVSISIISDLHVEDVDGSNCLVYSTIYEVFDTSEIEKIIESLASAISSGKIRGWKGAPLPYGTDGLILIYPNYKMIISTSRIMYVDVEKEQPDLENRQILDSDDVIQTIIKKYTQLETE